jgi:hypothetical protein
MKSEHPRLDKMLHAIVVAITRGSSRPPRISDRDMDYLCQREVVLTLLRRGLDYAHQEKIESDALMFLFSLSCTCYQAAWAEGVRHGQLAHVQSDLQSLILQHFTDTEIDRIDFERVRELVMSMTDTEMVLKESFLDRLNELEFSAHDASFPVPDRVPVMADVVALLEKTCQENTCRHDFEIEALFAGPLSQLDPDMIAIYAQAMLASRKPQVCEAIILLLLHTQERVAGVMLEELDAAVAAGHCLTPTALLRLTVLRNWVNKPVRGQIDALIKTLKQNLARAAHADQSVVGVNSSWTLRSAYASSLDSRGAMSLQFELKYGKDIHVVGFVLRQGKGLSEGFVSRAMSAKESRLLKQEQEELIPLVSLDESRAAGLLAHFIAGSVQAGFDLPSALLVLHGMLPEFARETGWNHPKLLDAAAVLGQSSGPAGRPARRYDVIDVDELIDGWCEQRFSELAYSKREVFTALEAERALWQERITLSLHTFSSALDGSDLLLDALSGLLAGEEMANLDLFQELIAISTEIDCEVDEYEDEVDEDEVDEDEADGESDEWDDDPDQDDTPFGYEPAPVPSLIWNPPARKPVAAYQLHILLQHTKPAVWRRIRVRSDVTLQQLHELIQIVMDWDDEHLYQFRRGKDIFEPPSPDTFMPAYGVEAVQLRDLLYKPKGKLGYLYDWGDNWEMQIVLEQIGPFHKDSPAVELLDVNGAAPPENCGGIPGFLKLLHILKDPSDDEYQIMRDWLGLCSDERFDPQQVMHLEGIRDDLLWWSEEFDEISA